MHTTLDVDRKLPRAHGACGALVMHLCDSCRDLGPWARLDTNHPRVAALFHSGRLIIDQLDSDSKSLILLHRSARSELPILVQLD